MQRHHAGRRRRQRRRGGGAVRDVEGGVGPHARQYQQQLKAGIAEAEAQQAAAEKARSGGRGGGGRGGAAARRGEAERDPRRQDQPLRRRLGEIFGEVAPVEYVDYGVSNSGDPTVGYVRMKTAIGAAEAVRILAGRGVTLEGAAVAIELLTGATLRSYLSASARSRRRRRGRAAEAPKWWDRKYGKAADGDAGTPAGGRREWRRGRGRGRGRDGREAAARGGRRAAARRLQAREQRVARSHRRDI